MDTKKIKSFSILVLAVLASICWGFVTSDASPRPHIIVIVADDLVTYSI